MTIPGEGPVGLMRDGRVAINLRDHRGLIAGDVHVGEGRDGNKIFRTLYWYPGGEMTRLRETDYDLVERIAAMPIARITRTTAGEIAARTKTDLFEFDQDARIDHILDGKEWF